AALVPELDGLLGAMDERIVFVISFFLYQLPALATLPSDIDEGSLGAHDARRAIGIVAEAGRVADQEAFGILQQRLEGVRILAAVMPRVDAAHGDDGLREGIFQEVVHQIDAMTHPLIGDAAGEISIETKFKVGSGIEWTIRLGEEPFFPVRVFLTNLAYFFAAAPAGTVIIPHHLHL